MVPDEENNAAEQPTAPDAGAGAGDPAAVSESASTGEGEPGGAATGGTGGESQPEPEATEEGGSEIPESPRAGEDAPAEATAPTTAVGESPADPTTPPSSPEPPSVGLPSGDANETNVSSGTMTPEKGAMEMLKETANEGLDKAKEIGRATLKKALVESRDFIKIVLNDKSMTEAEKHEVARLYRAAEKHALAGKVAVAHAMGKRLDNFVKSSTKVHKSAKARAAQNYLTGLLKLATGAVNTFLGAFGVPLVDKLADIGLTATDEFLQ